MKKKTIDTVAVKVAVLLAEAKQIDLMPYDPYGPRREAEDVLIEKIKALDKEAGKGLMPGRYLKFQVADGYAHYIVLKVGKSTTKVQWIPMGDRYYFLGVANGEIMTKIAERHILAQDAMFDIFSKNEANQCL